MRFRFGDIPEDQEELSVNEDWRRIHSPNQRVGYLLAGLAGLAFLSVLCVIMSTVSSYNALHEVKEAGVSLPMPWGSVILALLLSIPLHEFFHAIWHPGFGMSRQTVVVVWPSKLRFGVYYEGCMTRGQWLLMRISPLVGLYVTPAGLLILLWNNPIAYALEVFLNVLMVMNAVGSGGDVIAIVWVLFQVPKEACICFSGGKAYWRPGHLSNVVSLS